MRELPGGYIELGGLILSPDRQQLVADVLSQNGHGREDRLTVISHGLGADIRHTSEHGPSIEVHVKAEEVDGLLSLIDPALGSPETEAVDTLSVNPFICQYTAGSVVLEHSGGTEVLSVFSALDLGQALLSGERAAYLATGGTYEKTPGGGTWTPRYGETVDLSADDVETFAQWLVARVAPDSREV